MFDAEAAFGREPRFIRERFDDIRVLHSKDLAKGLIPAEGFGFLAGPSGSYKTFLALEWSFRIAQGAPILRHRTTSCAVVYVAAEAPNGVRRRIDAWKRENSAGGLPFELIGQAPDLRDSERIEDLIVELRIAADEFAARGHRLGFVVIDTLAASMPGADENSGSDMSLVLANVTRMATELEAFILVVSHTGKDEARGLRGWSGQFAGADLVIMLTREASEAGGEVRVGKVAKLKDGEDGQRFAVGLKPVLLGVDDDGDEVSSAVIVYEDPPESGTKGRRPNLNAAAQLTLDAMHRLEDEGRTENFSLVPGLVAGTKGARLELLRQTAFAIGLKKAEEPPGYAPKSERDRWLNTRRKAFQRAIDDLRKTRRVGQEGDWVWLL